MVGPRPEMPFITAEYGPLENDPPHRSARHHRDRGQLSADRRYAIHQSLEYDLYASRTAHCFRMDIARFFLQHAGVRGKRNLMEQFLIRSLLRPPQATFAKQLQSFELIRARHELETCCFFSGRSHEGPVRPQPVSAARRRRRRGGRGGLHARPARSSSSAIRCGQRRYPWLAWPKSAPQRISFRDPPRCVGELPAY